MKFDESKIHVVYEAANPIFNTDKNKEAIQQTMDRYNIDSKYILCLSTVEPRKNMLRTIKAYEKCILNNMLSARKSAYSNKNRVLNNALPLDESILLQSFEFDLIAREQNREFIESARQKLSEFEFLVFSLHTMQYSYGEIAKIVNKSEKSVNNAIQRIHKKLRQ